MIIADQKSCPSTIAAVSVGLRDGLIPIVFQAGSCSERVLWVDAGLLYREHANAIVVHEVTERNKARKAVSSRQTVNIPGAQAGGRGGVGCKRGGINRRLCVRRGI
jgi:hypothetical protein